MIKNEDHDWIDDIFKDMSSEPIFSKNLIMDFLYWLTRADSPYAVMYGDGDVRFCSIYRNYTPEQLFDIFLKEINY